MSNVEMFLLYCRTFMKSSLEKAIYQRAIFLLHLFLGAHFRYNIISVHCSLERLPIAFSLFLWKTSVTRLPFPKMKFVHFTLKIIVTYFYFCRRSAYVFQNQQEYLQTSRCWVHQRNCAKKFHTGNWVFRILQTAPT